MPADIIVRVGAALDRSTDAVFAEMEKRARDMHGSNQREARKELAERAGMSRQELALVKATNSQKLAIERDRYRENSRLNRLLAQEQLKTERALALQSAQISRQRTKERLSALSVEEKAERDYQQRLLRMKLSAQREANRAQRSADRQRIRDEYANAREIDRFATRTSHRATRFFFPRPEGAIGYGKRVAQDLVRGAGVDTSLSGGFARARERQSMAVALSNQGWNPDTTKFEDRISAGELDKIAKEQAGKLSVSASDVLEGMTKFTDVTGDLQTAKTVIGDIGLLAKATGTDLASAASAAADISAQLPDDLQGKERQEKMKLLLGVAAMQGKRGAVEVKDLARYVPKMVAQAGSFSGDEATNMVNLMAIAQTARRYGGASNAAIASTSVASMVNTLKTPARVGQFREHLKSAKSQGLIKSGDIYDESGKLRGIQDIIKDSIIAAEATRDPNLAFKKMWANVQGARAVEGFRTIYQKAGGGKAGLAAVDAEFGKYTKALDVDAQNKMLAEVNQTTDAKAQAFQNKLDAITESMANNLLPTLEKLAPKMLELANAFTKAVAWAVENPWKSVMIALTASIARAGFESLGRMMLERVIMGFAGQAAGGAAGGIAGNVAGGVAGGALRTSLGGAVTGLANMSGMSGVVGVGAAAATSAIALAAIGTAAYTLTSELLEYSNKVAQSNQQERARDTNEKYFEGTAAIARGQNPLEKFAAYNQAKERIIKDEEQRTGSSWAAAASPEARAALKSLEEFYVQAVEKPKQEQANAAAIGAKGQLSEAGLTMALTGALVGKTLNVRVTNASDISMTPVGDGAPGGGPPRKNANWWDP